MGHSGPGLDNCKAPIILMTSTEDRQSVTSQGHQVCYISESSNRVCVGHHFYLFIFGLFPVFVNGRLQGPPSTVCSSFSLMIPGGGAGALCSVLCPDPQLMAGDAVRHFTDARTLPCASAARILWLNGTTRVISSGMSSRSRRH